ncbi:MAG: hypothetical protein ACM3TN_15640 [Alphaproteobacteria bacterium]
MTKLMLALTALLFAQPALAGSMYFGLSLTGSQVTLTNQGNASAFYPAVFRMLADGSWAQLKATSAPAELAAGAHFQLTWPETRPEEDISEIERMQPVMVCFFDQSGVSFGQITFFNAPPEAKTVLKAGYVNGALQIALPAVAASSIKATWVLWSREEGIKPIRLPVRFAHHPPPALRIDWRDQGKAPFQLDTGAGRPAVILLHETEQGYTQQYVPDGDLQGREQRASWLDATPQFYKASLIALVFATGAMVLQFLRRLRGRVVAASDGGNP